MQRERKPMKPQRISAIGRRIARRLPGNRWLSGPTIRVSQQGDPYSRLREMADDEGGAIYALLAISMAVIIGFVGLGVDVANWYAERRTTQNIADSAAVAGTYAALQDAGDSAIQLAAEEDAARQRHRFAAGARLLRRRHPQ